MRLLKCCLIILLFSLQAHAIEWGKVEGADNDRWTLGDWLSQMDRFEIMDSWLAMNTSEDIFWLVLGGGTGNYEVQTDALDTDYDFSHYRASLWISIFGLEYFLEESDENINTGTGLLSLRFFGKSVLGSQFVIFGGRRKWELEDDVNPNKLYNPVAGGRMQLYLMSFFGLNGEYRYHFHGRDQTNRKVRGHRGIYGAFIQLSRMRLFGNVIHDEVDIDDAGTKSNEIRKGFEAGASIYF